MIEFVFPEPLTTAECDVRVTLYFERIYYLGFQFQGAKLELIDTDPVESIELAPNFFWALLDEDAHVMYEAAIKHLQDNESPKLAVNASGHHVFEFQGADFDALKTQALDFMRQVPQPQRFIRFSANRVDGGFLFKLHYLGNPHEPVCD